MNVDTSKPVKDIVAAAPNAARVFEQMGIDYCCGGAKPLGEACRAANRPLSEVIQALEAAGEPAREGATDWSHAPLADVIEHVVGKHHAYCRQEQERIALLLDKVVQAHGARRPELGRMQSLFDQMKKELSMHLMKEESTLFPMILEMERAASRKQTMARPPFGTIRNPISMMIREHEDSGAELKEMNQLSHGYQPPEDACNSTRSLYQGLREFEQDMHQHIYLENYILFPRAVELEHQLDALRAGA
ncbi:MAG: iron-sulfur cluster repair di-iron protein [Terriglobia bacterium]